MWPSARSARSTATCPAKEGYLLTREQLAAKIEETLALGGNQILLQGGLHPDLGIEFYEELFRWIKGTYPIWIHGLSPAEVKHVCPRLVADAPRRRCGG